MFYRGTRFACTFLRFVTMNCCRRICSIANAPFCGAVSLLAVVMMTLAVLPDMALAQKPRAHKSVPSNPGQSADRLSPRQVFDEIERSWVNGSERGILKHYGKARVTLAVDGDRPQRAKVSKNQSYYLLKDLFKFTITRKFEFVQYRESPEAGTAFAVAERHYQRADDGRLIKDKVYVALEFEGRPERGRWVVTEIKSIR